MLRHYKVEIRFYKKYTSNRHENQNWLFKKNHTLFFKRHNPGFLESKDNWENCSEVTKMRGFPTGQENSFPVIFLWLWMICSLKNQTNAVKPSKIHSPHLVQKFKKILRILRIHQKNNCLCIIYIISIMLARSLFLWRHAHPLGGTLKSVPLRCAK